jgi:hypothetical protein
MNRAAKSFVGLAILCIAFGAVLSAHHFLKQDIYVYDLASRDYISGAKVTVSWSYAGGGGSTFDYTDAPHGNVQFRLPGELDSVQVVVEKTGYCDFDQTIALSHRPHVGGRGIWIGLYSCPD